MTLNLKTVEALAPDQAALEAARRLLKPGTWPTLAAGGGAIWGECLGSGATPYRVIVSEEDAGCTCSCPSRKFPCKHSLALMWLRAEGAVAFTRAPLPGWVSDWQARRRGGTPARPLADQKPGIALHADTATAQAAALDPRADVRAAARARQRLEREALILAGLEEFDLWLLDQLETGLARFVTQAGTACRLMAQRLVDAKASGLATRLDTLPTRLFALPEAARAAAAVEELGLLYLLAEAYRRQDTLSPALRADVRQAIGWSLTRETLLADDSTLRVTGTWRVVATLSEVQPDRLRRLETWLWQEGAAGGPRFAALIDFVPLSLGTPTFGYSTGDRFAAELVFHPAAVPLRAMIARQLSGTQPCTEILDLPVQGLEEAYQDYEQALQTKPWLGAWPLSFQAAHLRRQGETLFLCGGEGPLALPLVPAQAEDAAPLLDCAHLDGIGIWDGRAFTLCWAHTALGQWGHR